MPETFLAKVRHPHHTFCHCEESVVRQEMRRINGRPACGRQAGEAIAYTTLSLRALAKQSHTPPCHCEECKRRSNPIPYDHINIRRSALWSALTVLMHHCDPNRVFLYRVNAVTALQNYNNSIRRLRGTTPKAGSYGCQDTE
ncbi:hypothetical protein KAX35_08055 [candidate division WOR-3 bacterium]|nr:hypothetical protein [candidate division WOR-3 bacterium]